MEGDVTSYKERLCIITSELDALMKELTLDQEHRRNVESELTNTKEYVGKLLVERRKLDSFMVEMSTNAYYDAEKLDVANDQYDPLCGEN